MRWGKTNTTKRDPNETRSDARRHFHHHASVAFSAIAESQIRYESQSSSGSPGAVILLDILVIGDKEHGRVRCVDWMEEFPNIEEFDLIIIVLSNLTQDIFDRIPDKCASISREVQTVWTNGRLVWCIMGDMLVHSRSGRNPKTIPYTVPSSYDWLPVRVVVDRVKPGSSVQVADSISAKKFRLYLEKVKEWDMEIGYPSGMPYHAQFGPIATNKSNKMISAELVWNPSPGSQIALLPKPTACDIHEAVELLIDIATGEDRLEPEWTNQIEIPGILEIDANVRKHEEEIAFTQKQIEELKAKRLELEKYRDVFSVHEDSQIEAVKMILHDMDIETERTRPRFVVDLLGKEIAVEVTSVADKIGADSDSLIQLVRFQQQHRKNEKLVLVANTHKRENPRVRKGKMDFIPEALSILKENGICAMTSATLLGIWTLAKEDKTKARRKILEENGEVRV
jgi:hypothetical protein